CPKRGTRTSKTVPIVDPRKFRIFSEQALFLAFLSSLEFLFLLFDYVESLISRQKKKRRKNMMILD
ncbi:hypothetical protein, partial [uncultured Chryseobacterium sp.]|uniref:hypothetical protein n=1 Tax=uncultured Chryseobacterium sp. TaxID=259322 RepID=UPI0025E0DA13